MVRMMEKILALESTVIAHGLPFPINIDTAVELEELAAEIGCSAKTIGIIAGQIKVGLSREEIVQIASRKDVLKIGTAEIPFALAKKMWAATTVSATMRIAHLNNIKVFATGGIGGVHKIDQWDVSQDLAELSRTRMIVVSAGPKSILDLRSTVEMLETFQITVVGYKTDELPAFYCKSTSIHINRVDSFEEIASIFLFKEKFNLPGAVLVFNPIPDEHAIEVEQFEEWYRLSEHDLDASSVKGKGVTPFLLSRLAHYSKGKTVRSNVELLKNNVKVACEILNQLSKMQ